AARRSKRRNRPFADCTDHPPDLANYVRPAARVIFAYCRSRLKADKSCRTDREPPVERHVVAIAQPSIAERTHQPGLFFRNACAAAAATVALSNSAKHVAPEPDMRAKRHPES